VFGNTVRDRSNIVQVAARLRLALPVIPVKMRTVAVQSCSAQSFRISTM